MQIDLDKKKKKKERKKEVVMVKHRWEHEQIKDFELLTCYWIGKWTGESGIT